MNTAATELTHDQQADVNAHLDRVNQSINDNPGKDAILALCARLQAAAIKCDDYHVFVDYSPHVGTMSVLVRNSSHNYTADIDTWPAPILNEHVYLNEEDAIVRLIKAIDQLQRLGIDV